MKAAAAVMCGTLLLVTAAIPSSARASVEGETRAVEEALAALDAGRAEDALELLEAAVRVDGPRRFAVWSLLGRTQLRLRRPEEAARSFEEALARAPGFLPARVGKAEADIARGRREEADSELERLAALSAPPARALELLAGLRLCDDELDAARTLWRRLAEQRETSDEGRRLAELLLQATEGSFESRDRLHLEVERDLSKASVYLALGVERLLAGEPAAAGELLRVAFEIDEDEPIVKALLERVEGRPAAWPAPFPGLERRVLEVYALWEARRLDEALSASREILDARPNHAPVELIVTRIAEQEGDHWRALEGYERLLRRLGDLPSIAAGAARAALRAGAFGAAECGARKALRLRPGDTALLRLLATARLRSGARDEAISILREAIALEPLAAQSWLQLGDVLFDGMRAEEAIDAYRRAVELEPGAAREVPPFALSALVAEAEGTLGTELLARLAERHPEGVDTLYSVGVARLRDGDPAGAEQVFQELAKVAPTDSQLAYNLGQAYLRQGRRAEAQAQIERFRELKAAEDAEWELHNRAHFRRLAAREHEAAGRGLEAMTLLEANAAEGTADVSDYLAIARHLLDAGRPADSLAWVERVLDADPFDSDALELLALVERTLGRGEELERTRWKLEILARSCGG